MSRVTAYICTTIQRGVNGSGKREDFTAPTLPELIDHLVELCSSSCEIQGIWELREGPDGHDEKRALSLDEHSYTDPMRKWWWYDRAAMLQVTDRRHRRRYLSDSDRLVAHWGIDDTCARSE